MGCTQSAPSDTTQSRKNGQSIYGVNNLAQAGRKSELKFSDPDSQVSQLEQKHHGGRRSGLMLEQMPASSLEARFGAAKVRYAYMSKRGHYPDDPHKPNQDSFHISSQEFAGVKNHTFLSIFDGHGPEGHVCAWYARDNLHEQFETFYRQGHCKATKDSFHGELPDANPKNWPDVMPLTNYMDAATMAHVKTNEKMRASKKVNDLFSGTTAVSVGFHQDYVLVCNLGDSRVILGHSEVANESTSKTTHKAMNLSIDQTPFRKDERDRVKLAGAMVRSLDQLDGLESIHENWKHDTSGQTIDEEGDPPRLWHKDGEYPGCAFTRSLGDSLAEEIGVFAEPELHHRQLVETDKMIILVSDGVYEFLSSQTIVDMCAMHEDPLDACKSVVRIAYDEWLKRETRTDDITMICIYIDELINDEAASGDNGINSTKENVENTEA